MHFSSCSEMEVIIMLQYRGAVITRGAGGRNALGKGLECFLANHMMLRFPCKSCVLPARSYAMPCVDDHMVLRSSS